MSSINGSISAILNKPNKTTDDLQQVIDEWHQNLLRNEEHLLQFANQLEQKQQSLNQTTNSIIQTQNLLANLEKNLQQFQLSVQTLAKYNDELETSVEQLNADNRSITYELMDSVDTHLNELDQTMKQINNALQINTDHSILKTTDELQTCFHDVHNLQETIKQIKIE
ncbi:unnamed protein product [Adineta ricciae]|uniref:Uncharacterized protein n=1 Tax=Adineta ricciae TaxID=249248 RepID=A0A814IKV3_ADIRI|nr:unnamed protein product [Adineta ricciae]